MHLRQAKESKHSDWKYLRVLADGTLRNRHVNDEARKVGVLECGSAM